MTSFYHKPQTLYSDPDNGARWKAEDEASVKAQFEVQQARVNASIKSAVDRGVKPGIEGEPGHIIPPPPSFDPFHGKVCLAVGVQKNGFGQPKICGRQAIAVLRTFAPDVPEAVSAEARAAELNAMLAMQVYGAGNTRIPVGGGPAVGHMVKDPLGPPGADEHFVCYFHGMAAHKDHVHPDDNQGIVPDVTPKPDKPLMGLAHLNSARQWRTVQSDPNFCAVTDGITTALVPTRDYIVFLRENGTLPESGQPL